MDASDAFETTQNSVAVPRDVFTSISVIQEIEKDAQRLATSVDELIEDMTGTLQSVSFRLVAVVRKHVNKDFWR